MAWRWFGWLLLAVALVACGPVQEDLAVVSHWTDFDDGSAALAEFGEEERLSTLEAGAGRYIVSRNGALRNLESFVRRQGDTLVEYHPDAGFAVVETSAPARYARFADVVVRDVTFQRDPGVAFEFEPEVGDPPFSGAGDLFFDVQWGHNSVRAQHAWAQGVRGDGVRVAVLDNGFDLAQLDLLPNINQGLAVSFVPGEPVQFDFTEDWFSHGTHVAGTLGAAQNDWRIIGVAPDVELVLVKVLADAGAGAFSWVMSGMYYAADVGADIANMSLGALLPKFGGCLDDVCITPREAVELRVAMQRAANYGTWRGTLFVSSAGNSAVDMDANRQLTALPADLHRVVAVSATAPIGWATHFQVVPTGSDDEQGLVPAIVMPPPVMDDPFLDNLASYSNYGRSVVGVSAPGGDVGYPGDELCVVGVVGGVPCWLFDAVFSAVGAGGYGWSIGTSMAAPHASGVAALILSETPSLRGYPLRLEQELYRRADSLGLGASSAEHGRGAARSGY